MTTSLDEDALERSRKTGRREYNPADGNHLQKGVRAAVVGTDYLTASLGRYEGGAPSGAFPADRYRGHRIRCKAVMRSNMANDKGREVRLQRRLTDMIGCEMPCKLLACVCAIRGRVLGKVRF